MHRPRLAAAAVSLVLLLGACGSDDDASTDTTESTSGDPTELVVSLTEFEITASPTTADEGTARFSVTNEGTIPHDFIVTPTDLEPDGLPTDDSGDVDESALEIAGSLDAVEAGADAELDVDLPTGDYVLFCNVPGHYAAGMTTSFTVG